jgi:predicted Zn-dependent protease
VTCALAAAPASAQLGNLGSSLGKARDAAKQAKSTYDDVTISDAEEVEIGSQISEKLRDKYGVVQDPALHKYVTLVGTVLAQASPRPNLRWTFIVLDTDGINAFAAPGGFVHITRGALALIRNEGELAGVLGHEISHVTAKHTINAIRNAKIEGLGSKALRSDVLNAFADRGYDILLNGELSQGDEKDADRLGVALANRAGYAPAGLGAFLARLLDRNKGLSEPSGLFASHPKTQERLDALTAVIAKDKLHASGMVAARYAQFVSYKPVPVSAVPQTSAAASKPAPQKSGKLGLSGLNALGREKSNDQTVSSAGSRGVNPDRDAKGGPDKALVAVSVTPAEVAEFKKGISG